MAIENTVSIDFDPRSSIVDSVFDCRLPDVMVTVFLFSRWFTVISRKDRNSPKYEQFSSEDQPGGQSERYTEKEMDVSATWISYIDVDGDSILS